MPGLTARPLLYFRPNGDLLGRFKFFGQAGHDLDRLHADADDLAHQPDDVLGVVGPVRIGLDAAPLVFRDLLLIDNPFQGAAVADQ